MTLDHLREVREVSNTGEADGLLADGWTLLGVQQDPYGQPHYVLGRATRGVTKITVSWADDAIERSLQELIYWRDGDGVVERHHQAVLVAIDCLRTVLGKDDE